MKTKTTIILFIFMMIKITCPAQIPKLAYIYAGDDSRGRQWAMLLNPYAYQVDLFDTTEIMSIIYEDYKLVIIGENSGSMDKWTTMMKVEKIATSNKPIMGLGDGGYAFFGRLGLPFGYPNGLTGNGYSVFVPDPGHTIFNNPYPLPIPEDSILQVYTNPVPFIAFPTLSGIQMEKFARAGSSGGNYILARENYSLFSWGFDASPNLLTNSGKELFLNVVNYIREMGSSARDKPPADFNLYPNPADHFLTLRFNNNSLQDINLSLADITGNILKSKTLPNQQLGICNFDFDLKEYPAGIYFCTIHSNHFTLNRPFCISR